ncbi:MAG TPA: preprotein translocase subunit SecG [Acetobacteraceae bacterium]|nr:preprotein translocase subunit SecG [Acetobacteraceae bacterium]
MTTVLVILQVFVALALVGVVLIQRSEGGGLGIGGSQSMGGLMSGRGTANLLTRTTAILGTVFFALCLVIGLLDRGASGGGSSILNAPPPVHTPAGAVVPAVPVAPATPPAIPPAPGPKAKPAATPAAPAPAAPAQAAPAPTAPGPTATTPSTPAPATPGH